MPLFSVILPTYNRAEWVGQAIQSVLNQSFCDFELIIIDDGSTDNTKEVVSRFNDPRIKYHYQENKERSAARNSGIKLASGDYVCFLDSDDVYLPWHLDALAKSIEYYLKLSPQLIFTDIDEFSNFPLYQKSDPDHLANSIKIITPSEGFEFALLKPIVCMRWCVSKELIERHLFNENLRIGEDTELFTRLASHVKAIIHIVVVTVLYSEHSNRTVNKELTYLNNLKALDLIFSNNPLAKGKNYLKRKCLHGNYLALARHFNKIGKPRETYKYLWKSLLTGPFSNLKEKMFIAVDSII